MMRRWDPSRCNIYLHFYAEFYHFIGNWRIKLWIREYDGGIDYFERMFAAYILTYNLPGVFLAGGKHSSLEVERSPLTLSPLTRIKTLLLKSTTEGVFVYYNKLVQFFLTSHFVWGFCKCSSGQTFCKSYKLSFRIDLWQSMHTIFDFMDNFLCKVCQKVLDTFCLLSFQTIL